MDALDPPTGPRGKQAPRADDPMIGRVLADRYVIEAPIGRGGAGNVYRAVQRPLGRKVAIKLLRLDLTGRAKAEFQARFLREAALCSQLSHPNLVTVHDFGASVEGAEYVVMELLSGPSLQSIAREGLVEPRRAARIALGIARGLGHAHAAGLVHRDVKPTNILIERLEDGSDRPVLVDFGLVKVSGPSRLEETDSLITRAGTYLGTPAYMSPEQSKGEAEVGPASDVYSLGCVLYRMLSGKLPFEAENPLGMAVKHQVDAFPAFRVRAPEAKVPAELEAIVKRCMHKDPRSRYADGAALAVALEGWLEVKEAPRVALVAAAAGGAGVAGLLGAGLALGLLCVVLVAAWLLAKPAVPGVGEAVHWGETEPVPDRLAPEVAAKVEVGGPEGEPAVFELDPPVVAKSEPEATAAPEPVVVPEPVAVQPEPVVKPSPAVKPVIEEPVPEEPEPVEAPMPRLTVVPISPEQPSGVPGAADGALVYDEVPFTASEAETTLAFINRASPEELAAAGVYERGVEIVTTKRPFASMSAFAGTYMIGNKTVAALKSAALAER